MSIRIHPVYSNEGSELRRSFISAVSAAVTTAIATIATAVAAAIAAAVATAISTAVSTAVPAAVSATVSAAVPATVSATVPAAVATAISTAVAAVTVAIAAIVSTAFAVGFVTLLPVELNPLPKDFAPTTAEEPGQPARGFGGVHHFFCTTRTTAEETDRYPASSINCSEFAIRSLQADTR